jgi:hypothetical protein
MSARFTTSVSSASTSAEVAVHEPDEHLASAETGPTQGAEGARFAWGVDREQGMRDSFVRQNAIECDSVCEDCKEARDQPGAGAVRHPAQRLGL